MTLQTDGRMGYHNIPALSSKRAGIKPAEKVQNVENRLWQDNPKTTCIFSYHVEQVCIVSK